MMITTKQLKEKYLKFFEERGHKIIPSASLIPENDPTVLFTTAGMHPLVPYLLGEKHPAGNKLCNVQKCIRTGDIDEVGDDWHLTFFEMLGNWSLGGYWKKEAIEMSWEFLTDKKWLGLDKNKISVSIFKGEDGIPKDDESAEIWKSLGIKEIKFLGKEDNFWGPAGKTGPCGPCTEIFYDPARHGKPGVAGGGVEIWNNVFMEFNKTANGTYEPLKQKNVDTGMGVERTTAILNGFGDVYEIDTFKPIILEIEKLSGKKYENYKKEFRIIADHIKAATFMSAEKIEPSNTEKGYVLRRLIRRAVCYGKLINIQEQFCFKLVSLILEIYQDFYLELKNNKEFIEKQLIKEEEKFRKTLERGLKILKGKNKITGEEAFDLFQTYGFPIELTREFIERIDYNITIEEKIKISDDFNVKLKKHQELSRTATAGKFKSGLADNSEQVTKLHTATHLLLAGLRKILGESVFQKGSNITAERLRFDFSYSEKMTKEQIKEVEDLVNEQIKKDLPVFCEELSLEDAKKKNAMGVFESKYGDKVKVYSVENFSCEICSGPHAQKTGNLGHFKILKEEASSAGVRRIKAILE